MSTITSIQVDRKTRDELKGIADARGLKLYRLTTDLIRRGIDDYLKNEQPLGTPVGSCPSQPESFSNTADETPKT
jgi:hypothetical protein